MNWPLGSRTLSPTTNCLRCVVTVSLLRACLDNNTLVSISDGGMSYSPTTRGDVERCGDCALGGGGGGGGGGILSNREVSTGSPPLPVFSPVLPLLQPCRKLYPTVYTNPATIEA